MECVAGDAADLLAAAHGGAAHASRAAAGVGTGAAAAGTDAAAAGAAGNHRADHNGHFKRAA